MEAIVEVKGFQYRLKPGARVVVPRLGDIAEGEEVVFDRVLLLVDDDGNVTIGTPQVEGARVKARVLRHFKDRKILVFKKKRRKRYQGKRGHRQPYTQIEVLEVQKN